MTRRRVPVRLLALAAAGLLLAGCGGQVGAAAVVGSSSISTDTIDDLRTALDATAEQDLLAADPGVLATRVAQDRALVTYAIWHEQVSRAGLTPNDQAQQQIEALRADPATATQVATLLRATPETVRQRLADTLVLGQLASDAASAGTPLTGPTIEYEFIRQPSLQAALDARTRYAGDPAAWAADLAAAGSSDGGSGTAVAVGAQVTFIPTGLFSAAPGSFVAVPGQAGDGTATVLRVVQRSVGTAPLDPSALQQLGPIGVSGLGAMVLAQQGQAAGPVQVNPRFGVWDAELAQVVPAPAQL